MDNTDVLSIFSHDYRGLMLFFVVVAQGLGVTLYNVDVPCVYVQQMNTKAWLIIPEILDVKGYFSLSHQ